MKYKKPSSASVQDSATLLGGVVAGGAVSKGILGLIHKDKVGVTAEDQKKEDRTKMAKRAGLVVIGLMGASAIDGKDTMTAIVKGALTGMAGAQALELVSEFSSKNETVKSAVTGSTKAKVFLAQTLGVKGLGCPCNETASLNAARRHKRGRLRGAEFDYAPVIPIQRSNSLDAIVNAGKAS